MVKHMADEIDLAQDAEQSNNDHALAMALSRARMAPGVPGECDLCGEHSGRLVTGACAPCRDYYGLP